MGKGITTFLGEAGTGAAVAAIIGIIVVGTTGGEVFGDLARLTGDKAVVVAADFCAACGPLVGDNITTEGSIALFSKGAGFGLGVRGFLGFFAAGETATSESGTDRFGDFFLDTLAKAEAAAAAAAFFSSINEAKMDT